MNYSSNQYPIHNKFNWKSTVYPFAPDTLLRSAAKFQNTHVTVTNTKFQNTHVTVTNTYNNLSSTLGKLTVM